MPLCRVWQSAASTSEDRKCGRAMSRLYSLIFERQFKLQDLAKAIRFLFAKLSRSRPSPPAWREQPDFDEFHKRDFAETRGFEPQEFEAALPSSPRAEVTEEAFDTLPVDLQDEFVKSVAKAMQQGVEKRPTPPS